MKTKITNWSINLPVHLSGPWELYAESDGIND